MTNDIFCVGLTRTELQTLGVLLPITFQIISVSPEELDSLPCKDTPFLFTNEDFATGFLNAEYLRCGKTFDRPYVAIDKLANIPFGYLMQRKAWNIPASEKDTRPSGFALFEAVRG